MAKPTLASENPIPTPEGSERRQMPRWNVLEAELVTVDLGQERGALLIDASEDGIGLQTLYGAQPGATIPLTFELPDGNERVTVSGRVVWTDQGRVGLVFCDLAEPAKARLRKWLGDGALRLCVSDSPSVLSPLTGDETAGLDDLRQQIAGMEIDAALERIAEHAQVMTRCPGVAIELRTGSGLVRRATSGRPPAAGTEQSLGDGLFGACLAAGQIVRCEDTDTDPRADRLVCRRLGLRSVVILPLKRETEVVGVLGAFSDQSHAFESADVLLLRRLGELIVSHASAPGTRASLAPEPQVAAVTAAARPPQSAAVAAPTPEPEAAPEAPLPASRLFETAAAIQPPPRPVEAPMAPPPAEVEPPVVPVLGASSPSMAVAPPAETAAPAPPATARAPVATLAPAKPVPAAATVPKPTVAPAPPAVPPVSRASTLTPAKVAPAPAPRLERAPLPPKRIQAATDPLGLPLAGAPKLTQLRSQPDSVLPGLSGYGKTPRKSPLRVLLAVAFCAALAAGAWFAQRQWRWGPGPGTPTQAPTAARPEPTQPPAPTTAAPPASAPAPSRPESSPPAVKAKTSGERASRSAAPRKPSAPTKMAETQVPVPKPVSRPVNVSPGPVSPQPSAELDRTASAPPLAGTATPPSSKAVPSPTTQPQPIATQPLAPAPEVSKTAPAAPVVAPPPRVSQGITGGKLVHRVEPQYPPVARAMHLHGEVELRATVTVSGSIGAVRVVKGHPVLAAAAVQAVKQWRYEPCLLNGQPIEREVVITVNFAL